MGSVRSMPGVIVVNRHGDRFTNEGVTYQDFPKALGTFDPVAIEYPNRRAGLDGVRPAGQGTPPSPADACCPESRRPTGSSGANIGELAERIGARPRRLEAPSRIGTIKSRPARIPTSTGARCG